MQAGKGVREGRRHRAQPVFLSPQVTPGDTRVPSETIPVARGAQGTAAGHKADATGTAWVVGHERCWHRGVSRGTWGRSHKGRASKRSPKSRPDHAPATINNVCAEVGGTARPSLEEAGVLAQCGRKACFVCLTKQTLFKRFTHIHNQGRRWLLHKPLVAAVSKINFFPSLFTDVSEDTFKHI